MRIIGGIWRGRQIAVPTKGDVRPTGDRVREAWFSIIQFDVPNATVLDLCAGSGALGIEALSRGARHATFVDSSVPALTAIQYNLETLGASPSAYTLHRGDAVSFVTGLAPDTFSLGFADPPYALPVAAQLCDAWRAAHFATLFCVEHLAAVDLGDGGDRRRYGQSAISFFRA
ncbi:MAG TPA: 16S rRNA (guanine(966)-N(2))-methyltransferase RsmD [Gemmatimonadaceae bacterium]|nr:16S rRNA (guanine(966)-N(2))-methyltransferase RsmD [Gemmatimonadaceae bacterium]